MVSGQRWRSCCGETAISADQTLVVRFLFLYHFFYLAVDEDVRRRICDTIHLMMHFDCGSIAKSKKGNVISGFFPLPLTVK